MSNKAKLTLSAAINSALVIDAYSKTTHGGERGDLEGVFKELSASMAKVESGDTAQLEAMLVGHAHALQTVFTSMLKRAAVQDSVTNTEQFMRLGLKAQSQLIRTIEALTAMRSPPGVAFVRQANVQINNDFRQPELLGEQHALDRGTQSPAGGAHPAVETLAEVHRAENNSGQSPGQSKQCEGANAQADR